VTDDELVAQARATARDDMGAFEVLVGRYQGRVLANCRYLTGSASDAEDLAQEVFVKAYFALSRFEGRSAFKTWLWRIKINHCLNFLQRQKGRYDVAIEDSNLEHRQELQVAPTVETWLNSQMDRDLIGRIIGELSETLRVPLLLRDLDELSYQEIADVLGVALSAVKMRIKRGREEFRRRYAEALECQQQRPPISSNNGTPPLGASEG
jgi:RNA polymerase sigma-70 factor (ECF subfamily)